MEGRGTRARSTRALRGALATVASVVLLTTVAGPAVASPAPEATTSAATGVAPFRSIDAFVRQQFADLHGRSATSAELASGGAGLVAGTSSTAQAVDAIAHLPGAADRTGNVTRLYTAYFLRLPDISGLTYWVGKARAGTTLTRISASFAGSSEFTRRYGALSNGAFIDLAYQNVFGRAPDASGRAYWVRKLDAGTSRGQAMASFSTSSEYQRKQLTTTEVVLAYAGLLRRMPTAAEQPGAASRVAAAGFVGLAADLLAAPAYPARFPAPAAVTTLGTYVEDRQVTVEWKLPSGGPALAGVVVRPIVDGVPQAPRSTTAAATSLLVTGLANGTTVTFEVTAHTAQRDGAAATTAPVVVEPEAVWSGFQGDAAHTGEQRVGRVPDAPTYRWTAELGNQTFGIAYGDDRVFAVQPGLVGGSWDYVRIYALDPEDGSVLWGPVTFSASYGYVELGYAKRRVVVQDRAGRTWALDSRTGAQRWARDLGATTHGQEGLTISGGVLYTWASTGLTALDVTTGAVRWTGGATMNGDGTPGVSGTGVFVAQTCDRRYRFSTAGAKVWGTTNDCTGGGAGEVSIYAGRVWTSGLPGYPNRIVRGSDGALLGVAPGTAAPALSADGGVYNDGGTLVGFDPLTDAVRWNQAGNGDLSSFPAVINDGRAYQFSHDGAVYGFDLATGAMTWSRSIYDDDPDAELGGWDLQHATIAIGDGVLLVPIGSAIVAYG